MTASVPPLTVIDAGAEEPGAGEADTAAVNGQSAEERFIAAVAPDVASLPGPGVDLERVPANADGPRRVAAGAGVLDRVNAGGRAATGAAEGEDAAVFEVDDGATVGGNRAGDVDRVTHREGLRTTLPRSPGSFTVSGKAPLEVIEPVSSRVPPVPTSQDLRSRPARGWRRSTSVPPVWPAVEIPLPLRGTAIGLDVAAAQLPAARGGVEEQAAYTPAGGELGQVRRWRAGEKPATSVTRSFTGSAALQFPGRVECRLPCAAVPGPGRAVRRDRGGRGKQQQETDAKAGRSRRIGRAWDDVGLMVEAWGVCESGARDLEAKETARMAGVVQEVTIPDFEMSARRRLAPVSVRA